jgi:hypothetical protein
MFPKSKRATRRLSDDGEIKLQVLEYQKQIPVHQKVFKCPLDQKRQ